MERKYIICDTELCTGCGICEMVCSSEKEGVFCPELSRIHLVTDGQSAVSIACRFCEKTPCISACPREALTMDETTNSIRVDKIRCIGCGWCIEACDFGAISLKRSEKTVVLCDLCQGRAQPKCVEVCPKQALKVTTFEIEAQKTRGKAAKKKPVA
ncbi:MAG: 4Fe-4S dicluster domain-containing protein [Chloroflexota bacterium]